MLDPSQLEEILCEEEEEALVVAPLTLLVLAISSESG
jgi:hypothetical protein